MANKYTKCPISPEKRFWEKVDKRSDEECWNWIAAKDTKGYGVMFFRGRLWRSHRISWVIQFGSLDDKIDVLHHCDNPLCVNPKHLFLGNQSDNMRDKVKKNRGYINIHSKGENNPKAKLSLDDVRNIRKQYFTTTVTIKQLADEYELDRTAIQRITSYKGWEDSVLPFDLGELELGYFTNDKYLNRRGSVHIVVNPNHIPLCKNYVPKTFNWVSKRIDKYTEKYIECSQCKDVLAILEEQVNGRNMVRNK